MAQYLIHFNIRGTFNIHNVVEIINDDQYEELLKLYGSRSIVFDKNSPMTDVFDLSSKKNKTQFQLKSAGRP